MNTIKFILAIPSLCLLALPATTAATYYVATTGADTNPGTPTVPFRTIGKGIAAAAGNGDTILVADGTYNEHGLDFGAKNLVLQSQSGNPAACVLDCQTLGNGIFIKGGQTFVTTVSGLTVQNAVSGAGSFGSSTLYIASGSATLTNCIFRNNNSLAANGVLIGPGGSAILKSCTLVTTIAQSQSGAMLAARGDAVTLVNCSFADNVCSSLQLSDGISMVTGCNFTRNSCIGGGGGIRISGSASATITDCFFTGNHAASGGGLYIESGNASVSNCSFTGNDGQNFGGGIGQDGGTLAVQNCTFLNNRVQVKGGAVAVGNFRGISSLTLRNCLIARNTSDFGRGCAIDLDVASRANVKVTHCTIAENKTGNPQSSLEIMLFNEGGTLTVENSIVWNNPVSPNGLQLASNNGGTAAVTYSDVRGGYAGTGNLNLDPLFVNAPANNYHLQGTSPCIDVGGMSSGLPATDMEAVPRILGAAPDMGAFEAWLPTYGSWFVDKALGSDANIGAPTAPFATVTRAIAVALNGNNIYIKQGNYSSDRPRVTKSLHLYNWLNSGQARIGAP